MLGGGLVGNGCEILLFEGWCRAYLWNFMIFGFTGVVVYVFLLLGIKVVNMGGIF